jgi:hypothetical protein
MIETDDAHHQEVIPCVVHDVCILSGRTAGIGLQYVYHLSQKGAEHEGT